MPVSLNQYHPVKATIAILCMLLFVACLALFAWASNQGANVNGPIHIAADQAHVYVTFNEEILVLDAEGALEERHTLDELGVADIPIDIRLQDNGALLVATQHPAGLQVCDTSNWHCHTVDSPLFEQLRRQVKVLPDPNGEGLFISDTADGRLYWMSTDGFTTRPLTAQKLFNQVNDIALDEQQRLWVADSGNRRVAVLQKDADGNWIITDELSAKTDLSRSGQDWPMMIAISPAGNAWVVQPNPGGGLADLLIYDAQLGAKARIPLPEEFNPTDVARSGNSMLITDMDSFRINRVAIDSHAVTTFGDDSLYDVFKAAAAGKARFERIEKFAMVGMGLFGVLMIGMAIWATPKGQRFTPQDNLPPLEAQPANVPWAGELHWLVRNEKTEKFLRMAHAMLLVTTLGMVGAFGYAWYAFSGLLDSKNIGPSCAGIAGISEMFVVLGMLVIGIQITSYFGFRHMRNRLGSDGHYLHVKLHEGRNLTLDPARLVYTTRLLAYENHLFPIQTGNRKPLYADGEIETYIAPLLTRATKLSAIAMMRYQFRHRETVMMVSIIYFVLVAAALLYTGIWRYIFPA